MHQSLLDIPIVDCDSHVTEPPDLWTSRLPTRLRDFAPRLAWDGEQQELRWQVGGMLLSGVARYAMAGWREHPPSHPKSLEDADRASWHPATRLRRMDEYGIYAQVLYPNLLAFSTRAFLELEAPVSIACVQAYNDFLAEFAEADLRRLIPVMMLPFWDVEASCQELERAVALGHRGVLLAAQFDKVGLPPIWDTHWKRLLDAIQEAGLSVNFHVGFSEMTQAQIQASMDSPENEHARNISVVPLNNAMAIAGVVTSGLCHRYPGINFVSVESGASWLPFLMESLDWHWKNLGAQSKYPDMELPSFYLKRQVFGSFWFEHESVSRVIDLVADNIMFETDFPHPTSLSPGPASAAENPRLMAERALSGAPESVIRKVFFENAARVYGLDCRAR